MFAFMRQITISELKNNSFHVFFWHGEAEFACGKIFKQTFARIPADFSWKDVEAELKALLVLISDDSTDFKKLNAFTIKMDGGGNLKEVTYTLNRKLFAFGEARLAIIGQIFRKHEAWAFLVNNGVRNLKFQIVKAVRF